MKKANGRTYKNGGIIRFQKGYLRGKAFVHPHLKTYPGNKTSNNRKSLLGY